MSTPAEQWFARVSSISGAAAERATRLTVVPNRATRPPRVPFVVLVSVVALLGVVGLLMFNTSLQQASFTEAELTNRAAATADREETLRMELDDLRDPQRIAREAQRMGMVIPASPVFLTLDGTVVGEPAPAGPEDDLRIESRPKPVPAELRAKVRVIEVPAPAAPSAEGAEKAKNDSTAKTAAKKRAARAAGR